MTDSTVWRWLFALLIAVAIIALLAYARGKPGQGGRAPDRQHAGPAALVLHLPAR